MTAQHSNPNAALSAVLSTTLSTARAAAWLTAHTAARPGHRSAWLPGRCLLCAGPSNRDALCQPCLAGLPYQGATCPLCALAVSDPSIACGSCLRRAPAWVGATATLRYAFPADVLVHQLKYGRQLAAGRALAQAMLAAEKPVGSGPRPWLVPVPLHWTREAWRGFNQARELSVHLSRETGWPFIASALRRRRRTPAQAGLPAQERQRNLRQAFVWNGPELAGKNVILIDDVLTTGATASACCKAMSEAASVHLWVAARTPEPE